MIPSIVTTTSWLYGLTVVCAGATYTASPGESLYNTAPAKHLLDAGIGHVVSIEGIAAHDDIPRLETSLQPRSTLFDISKTGSIDTGAEDLDTDNVLLNYHVVITTGDNPRFTTDPLPTQSQSISWQHQQANRHINQAIKRSKYLKARGFAAHIMLKLNEREDQGVTTIVTTENPRFTTEALPTVNPTIPADWNNQSTPSWVPERFSTTPIPPLTKTGWDNAVPTSKPTTGPSASASSQSLQRFSTVAIPPLTRTGWPTTFSRPLAGAPITTEVFLQISSGEATDEYKATDPVMTPSDQKCDDAFQHPPDRM